ncbi:MAG: hypothetical protein M3R47_11755 [Chloroflexota bacterium]|nr:hypothetical protein [Chloroflexota bacterium]
MKYPALLILSIFVLILNACANQNIASAQPSATSEPTLTATVTPDPCSVENLSASIKEVNDLMREFDDIAKLAASVAREKVPELVSEMQRIRREAEDHETPTCLSNLKVHQITHMNTVIDTLIAFIGGAQAEALNEGISRAGQEHDLYTLEVARLLGIPHAPTTSPSATASP